MGQEWERPPRCSSSPITTPSWAGSQGGQAREFRQYAGFADPAGLEKILDCQSEQTSSPARSTGLSEIAGGMP